MSKENTKKKVLIWQVESIKGLKKTIIKIKDGSSFVFHPKFQFHFQKVA